MQMFDVQGIEITAPPDAVFEFVRKPANLSRWAQAFETADSRRARLKTPGGTAEIALATSSDPAARTVDWRLEFPDGSVALAQSRVTATTRGTSIYSFVLHAPPVPLEELEGALNAQRQTLRTELAALKQLMETA
ncbi:MAG TPA: SRPBCC family protein [Vicinamibacterales bacterium]|nr:SRPBCC family protein [Vicinamibacterales bacterium]